MGKASIKVSIRKIRIQLDRLVIIGNSSPVVLQHSRDIRTVIVSINKVRRQIDHLVQVFPYYFIINRSNLFTFITWNIRFGGLFRLLIFQLLTADKRTHKISREEITVQQNRLCQVSHST